MGIASCTISEKVILRFFAFEFALYLLLERERVREREEMRILLCMKVCEKIFSMRNKMSVGRKYYWKYDIMGKYLDAVNHFDTKYTSKTRKIWCQHLFYTTLLCCR